MKKTLYSCILSLVFLFISNSFVFSQVVEKHYYTDGVYQSNEITGPSIVKGDKIITSGNVIEKNGTPSVYIREVDTSGNEIWRTGYIQSGYAASPLINIQLIDGDIFASFYGLDSTALIRLQESSGKILWKLQLQDDINFCNFTSNRLICHYLGPSTQYEICTINKTSGKIITSKLTKGITVYNGLTMFNDGHNRIYVYDKTLYQLDTVNLGDTLWSYSPPGTQSYLPSEFENVIVDGTGALYITFYWGGPYYLEKIDPQSHKLLWRQLVNYESDIVQFIYGKNLYWFSPGTQYANELYLAKITLDSGKGSAFARAMVDTSGKHDYQLGLTNSNSVTIDANGDFYLGATLRTNDSIGNACIAKVSGTTGNMIFSRILESPRTGYNYIVNPSSIFSADEFNILNVDGKIFIPFSPNEITPYERYSGVFRGGSNLVTVMAAVDAKTGNQDFWKEFNDSIIEPSSTVKIVPLKNGKYAILTQEGYSTRIRLFQPSGQVLWSQFLNIYKGLNMAVNSKNQICAAGIDYPGYLNTITLDSNGNILYRNYISNSDTLKLLDVKSDSVNFYISYYSADSGAFVSKLSYGNFFQSTHVVIGSPARASLSIYAKDTLVLSAGYENLISESGMVDKNYNLPGASNQVKGIRLYASNKAVFYGGTELACSDPAMKSILWRETTANKGYIFNILPAKGNYLYALGTVLQANSDSGILAIKFNSKNGSIVWSKIIGSRYGYSCNFLNSVSDTITGHIYIVGAASVNNKSGQYSGTLWVLNDTGNVIDSYYDGTFPAHNTIGTVIRLPDGDILMGGQASYSSRLEASVYRYHYTTYKTLMGNVTQSNKITPLIGTPVYAIVFNPSDSSIQAIDTATTDSKGNYAMNLGDSVSNVYVKAAPSVSTYPDQMPTYADSSMFFLKAAVIKMDKDTVTKNFSTKTGINPGGKGFMAGLISQGANKTGDPIVHVQLFLMKDTVPVTAATTDASGNFSCANLQTGVYKVYVDVPTVNNMHPPVVILPASDNHINLKFLLHRNYLELIENSAINEPESITNDDFSIYPNPFKNNIEIKTKGKSSMMIQVYNTTGELVRTVLANQSEIQAQIDLTSLPAGLYIVKINDGQKEFTSKMIKE